MDSRSDRRKGRTLIVLAAVVSSLAPRAGAQAPELVKDINKVPVATSSFPEPARVSTPYASASRFVQIGPHSYFVATHARTGRELYRVLGGLLAPTLVKDIEPESGSSNPIALTPVGSKLFFFATDAQHGYELRVSDGTASGTKLVKDIQPGTGPGVPDSPLYSPMAASPVAGSVLFVTSGWVDEELWTSDGTAAGTRRLADIRFGPLRSSPRHLCTDAVGKLTYFSADDGNSGRELWVSDGTTAGTRIVSDIWTGSMSSDPDSLTPVGARMFFRASTSAAGTELWVSDGTSAGTSMVKDIRPGAMSGANSSQWVAMAGKLYFTGDDGTNGREVWVSDGTSSGTKMLKDTYPGAMGGGFDFPTVVGNTIYYWATTSAGQGLWATDGTAAGTRELVRAQQPFWPTLAPTSGSNVVFAARNDKGTELWISDGTSTGTKLLVDISPGSTSSEPWALTATASGHVIFAADGRDGVELWVTNGTVAGTKLLGDINPPGTEGSSIAHITTMGARLYFAADDGLTGAELWASDGTSSGTRLVKDILPGPSGSDPRELCVLGNTLVFVVTAGLTPGLWVSDGTTSGTTRLGGPATPSSLTRIGTRIYFAGTDANGAELWSTDGTALGTKLVKDILPGPGASRPVGFAAVGSAGAFVFSAYTASSGEELWISDGTAAGTRQLKDVQPGINGSAPRWFTTMNQKAYFTADDGSGGEVWVTDGTAGGTRMVANLALSGGSFSEELSVHGDKLYFRARVSSIVYRLYQTDGTAQGTKQLLTPGPELPSAITSSGSRHFYFGGRDPSSGTELWRSDGTASGTVRLPEIVPGAESGIQLLHVGKLGGRVFFNATDRIGGYELWSYDNGATADAFGASCGAPTMTATDPLLGKTMTVAGSLAAKQSVGVTILGLPGGSPPRLFGCINHVDLASTWFVLHAFAVTTTTWSYGVAIPNQKSLNRTTVAAQTWLLSSASLVGPMATNGVRLTFGDR